MFLDRLSLLFAFIWAQSEKYAGPIGHGLLSRMRG
jgi:hypothetical protein